MIGYWFRRLADVLDEHALRHYGPIGETLTVLADVLRQVANEEH